ncbi:saccharopine dehydrogenase [Psychrosphaera saromensis]|uniref:Saccharopine dehydrogenase n=1 Tax=Psychrosphaera saromensis TaxID=716813 RepID=A0A2S7UXN8_9GAMM|nr:saccharopine dehydrogenase NADP-binding domain-containing protein [Psychrosphaera saromensis]PQJ54252.1 saccharopine dehydrogenase [Psychrosphaera saromensis]GHB74770.1 saccharopine dehydrogenase [Psychrosphaera saromensis]GLQ12648.1 saccharopine dehydrogenase [Psychrosphaera saromensis]
MLVRRVLILGGYGNFGKRIAENLSEVKDITIIIAGRNRNKAKKLCQALSLNGANAVLESAVIDIYQATFVDELKSLSPDLVIHTGGPFQGQNYHVPQACISIGSHYIDLADDRRFVCDITSLNDAAKNKDLLVVSGASSVPGLSSTVIDSFIGEFSSLSEIDFAIAPGNKAERGEATVKGILSYTGHPFSAFHNGEWINQYGWMSPRKLNFGSGLGKRWLANIDIPDLELFPERYKPVNTVKFQAGLELPLLHFGMVFMAALAKVGLIKDWSKFTKPIFKSSELFKRLGTDKGAMQINLSGLDDTNQVKHIKWTLNANDNIGPYIPTISTIIIAKKLITGSIQTRGATPCLGLYTLEEFDQEAMPLGIFHQTEKNVG